jgi:hypothetical protein
MGRPAVTVSLALESAHSIRRPDSGRFAIGATIPAMTALRLRSLFPPVNPAYASLLAILLLVPLWPAAASSFTGNLERVMDQSITVLLPDGRLIDAKLPTSAALSGSALAAQYAFGDQVTVDCKSIAPVWDQAANLTHTLELRAIKFLRRPEPQEMSRAIQSPDWRRPGNLLSPPPSEAAPPVKPLPAPAPSRSDDTSGDPLAMLDKVRAVNLDRAAHLPNFLADEEASCYVQTAAQPSDKLERLTEQPGWRLTATVRSEVTFKGVNETRQQVAADGKLVPAKALPAGCIAWSGGYSTYFKPLFDPKCGTTFTFSKTLGKPGKQSWVYNFSTPPEGLCFSPSFSDFERAYAAHEGSVLIDISTGSMLSVVARSLGFPKAFPIMETEETVIWDVVKTGDETHLLPVSYDRVKLTGNGGAWRVSVQYTNHRHFEANTSITFQ